LFINLYPNYSGNDGSGDKNDESITDVEDGEHNHSLSKQILSVIGLICIFNEQFLNYF